MDIISEQRSFGGTQGVYRHASKATGTDMVFSLYLPPLARGEPVPCLLYLSGLTCSHVNVTEKGHFQQACAEAGLAFLAPDTSPRGLDLPGEHDAYDFGSGAGFYLDATEAPWSAHYRMERYLLEDLLGLVPEQFPILPDRLGVTGHSMGGHGALVLALKHPDRFGSVSAFAPICAPASAPWGQKAFRGYLGEDVNRWRAHDACLLIEDGRKLPEILVDQGAADPFLDTELKPEALRAACQQMGIDLTLRYQAGYDHSYYFIASFMAEHVAWAAERLWH